MSTPLDLPPSVDEELKAFRRLLDHGAGHFSLSIALCNSPAERDRIIGQLRETHPTIELLTIPPRTVDVYGCALEQYQGPPKALFVIGLESSVTSPDADSHTLRSLNASRDLWPNRYPCPVVFWMPEYAATALSQQARDFWRFISHRFYFVKATHEPIPRSTDSFAGEYLNAISLSHDEKQARIAELQARLASIEDRDDPTLQRHALKWWDELAILCQFTGDLDEALRIRREEELPVYDRLGDVRSKAVTMGKIADILQARGQLDEALRIQSEECIPVYERLGDVRSKAVTMGKIADILQARGQLDEALRIRREECIPVYDRLGDMREKAVTMGKIADILQDRGQLDEALRIRREEEVPVYDRVGDIRAKAVAIGRIASQLKARGQLDEALRIRREEELPVFDRLGDWREMAIARANIGMLLLERNSPSDIPEARDHLLWAYTQAEQRQYAETVQLRTMLTNYGIPVPAVATEQRRD